MVLAGGLILLGGLFVLLSRAASLPTTYVMPNGTSVVRRFPGDPNPKATGKTYWGASVYINGSHSLARHETPTGTSLSIHRSYYSWGDWNGTTSKMLSDVKDDLINNRLPHISTKTPGGLPANTAWRDVAAGKYDTALDDMLKKLDATGGPIWFSLYHEPEDNTYTGTGREKCEKITTTHPTMDCEGTATDWRAMQQHVYDRMKALGTKNIAFMPTLMSWTWNTSSGRNPADYWVAGIWDAYMIDHYAEKDADVIQNLSAWTNFVKWIEAKGLPFGAAEWGNWGTTNLGAEMQSFFDWSLANNKDMIAYEYFDVDVNGGIPLAGDQLMKFQDILKNSVRVQRIKDLGKPVATTTTTSTITPTTTQSSTITPTTTIAPTTTITPSTPPPTTSSPVANPGSKTKT